MTLVAFHTRWHGMQIVYNNSFYTDLYNQIKSVSSLKVLPLSVFLFIHGAA